MPQGELQEFEERYGANAFIFEKRWKQMFGKPPRKAVIQQYEQLRLKLVNEPELDDDEDDE